uniref:CCHC-type domain-containing protein n=1 Tax=Anopheles epiroticus TaxID=199890 RepID=A0A182PUQ5_9DIPT
MSTMFVFEPFDSTNCKIQRWLERLEIAFKIHRVTEEDKRDYLLHYMGSTTYDVLCNKLKNANPQTKSFTEIVSILQEHFNPNPLEILENFKFASRKQRENESLCEYLMDLEKLAQSCNFGDYLDKALRNQFVFGLQNRAIQSRLLEVRDLTLDKAKDIAFGMEMSNRGTDEIQGAVSTYSVQHIVGASKKKSKVPSTQRKGTCYRCGNEDHLADKCRHQRTEKKSNVKLKSYCNSVINVLGEIVVKAKIDNVEIYLPLLVTESERNPLLGRNWMKTINLNLNELLNANSEVSYCFTDKSITNFTLERILNKYPTIFSPGIGKIEGLEASLSLRKGAKPVFVKARPVAFAVRDA